MADEGPKQKSEEGMNEAAKDPAAPPDPGRTRRAPPTIRLRATEIFNETRKAGDAAMEFGATADRRRERRLCGFQALCRIKPLCCSRFFR